MATSIQVHTFCIDLTMCVISKPYALIGCFLGVSCKCVDVDTSLQGFAAIQTPALRRGHMLAVADRALLCSISSLILNFSY